MIEARRGHEWVLRLHDGDDLGAALRSLTTRSALILTGIGMLRDTELAFWNGSEYDIHTFVEPAELVSLQGNVGRDPDGKPVVHVHLSIAGSDASVSGGHFVQATAHNTVEIALLPLEHVLLDRKSEENGLMGLVPRVR